jgi:hypothetical protein
MHPQYGTTMNVTIDAAFTVQEILTNLHLSGFISQDAQQYKLALMDQQLGSEVSFDSIDDLYDGAILRIIELAKNKNQDSSSTSVLQLMLRHPFRMEQLPLSLLPNDPLAKIIEIAQERCFIDPTDQAKYQLRMGHTRLDIAANVVDNAVVDGAYLQLIQEGVACPSPRLDNQLEQLNDRLQGLQDGLAIQFADIKKDLSSGSSIAVDASRSVNPTVRPYETIDSMVNRLRQLSGEPPLRKIRWWSLKVYLLGLFLTILLVWSLVMIVFGGGQTW